MMDKKTFVQFVITSIFILGSYYLFTQLYTAWQGEPADGQPAPQRTAEAPEPAEQPPAETREPSREQAPTPEPSEEGEPAEKPEEEPGAPSVAPAPEVDRPEVEEVHGLTLQNDLIRTSWTNRGAALEKLWLRNYKAPYKGEEGEERPTLVLLRDFQEGYYSDVLERVTFLPTEGRGAGAQTSLTTSDINYEVVEQSSDRIVFEGILTKRLAVRKTITIEPDTYHYNVDLEFINRTDAPLRFTYRLRTVAGITREILNSRYLATAVGVLQEGEFDVHQTQADDLAGENVVNESTNIAWAGMVSQYFAAMTWAEEPDWIRAIESRLVEETDILNATGRWSTGRVPKMNAGERKEHARTNGAAVILSTQHTLDPAEELSHSYRFVAVPKLKEALVAYGGNLSGALLAGSMPWITWVISLGTLSFLAPLMVSILEFFHAIIPNYGIAIILLTILVRGALHPLTKSSQMSMHKMRLLQPKIKELQKKYGDQREKMVQEQMKLYSKYGVHPMSGCWPMLLQMPVFVSLFTALRTSVQLRQATFIPGWITDLSQADTVWHFPFTLPIMGNELNILPFIMVCMWMLNQHLTPTPSDPKAQQQQKIMKWMPVLFAVMFYQFASGLLLYITASSGFGALQNWWIRRQAEDLKLEPVGKKTKKKKKKKKRTTASRRAEPEKKGLMGKLMDKLEQQEKDSRQYRNEE